MNEKEIAKEILFEALKSGAVKITDFPGAKTGLDAICEAYKKILKTVKES